MDLEARYTFANTSLYKIRNRNELRVITLLGEILCRNGKTLWPLAGLQHGRTLSG
jgi:hypothetical protein